MLFRSAILAIGDNRTRAGLLPDIRHHFGIVRSASCLISAYATIGEGSMILHGAVVQARAVIGRHVIINTRASVGEFVDAVVVGSDGVDLVAEVR